MEITEVSSLWAIKSSMLPEECSVLNFTQQEIDKKNCAH
jgi:hypothetical protein